MSSSRITCGVPSNGRVFLGRTPEWWFSFWFSFKATNKHLHKGFWKTIFLLRGLLCKLHVCFWEGALKNKTPDQGLCLKRGQSIGTRLRHPYWQERGAPLPHSLSRLGVSKPPLPPPLCFTTNPWGRRPLRTDGQAPPANASAGSGFPSKPGKGC